MSDSATQAIVFDSRGAVAGASEAQKAAEKIINASRGIERATDAVGKVFETQTTKIVESTTRQMRQVDALARRLDPLGQSVRDASRDLDRLQRVAAGSGEAAERAAGLVSAAQARLASAQAATTATMRTSEAAHTSLTRSTGQTSMALRNLGIQSIDVFQQLASGAPIMMTMVQQGGQVAQMAAVTGTSLTTLAKSAAGVVASFAPWIAVGATVAGVGVALYTVFQRASELETQQRTLSVAIRGVGRDAELSTGHLQDYVTALKQQGVAAADAVKSIAELARNSGLSQGAIGRIVGLAPDAAAAIGQGVPETMKMLADAAKGTAESVAKLDAEFNLLTAAEAAQIRAMIDHGDKAGALETVFGKLEARVRGLNEDALSKSDKLFRQLANSWDDFMRKIVGSETMQRVLANIRRDIEGISAAMFGASGDALSREIVAGTGPLLAAQREAEEATQRLGAEHAFTQRLRARASEMQMRQDALIERARAESPLSSGPLASVGAASSTGPVYQSPEEVRARETQTQARARYAASDAGKLAALNREAEGYRTRLGQLTPGTEGFAAATAELNGALAATNKEIEELNKKTAGARTGMEKTTDTFNAQIRAANDLATAYGEGRAEVQRVIATREAEQKAISEGLTPGTVKYTEAVKGLTEDILRLRAAEGSAKVAEQVRDINEQTDAQRRIAAAYDGTEASVTRAKEVESAHAAAIKAQLIPGTTEYAEAVERLTEAYREGNVVSQAFAHMTSSVSAVFDVFATAADRVGQGLVNAILSGANGFTNLANVARAAFASILTDLAKLGIINPIINSIAGSAIRPTLFAAAGALAGGSGSASVGGSSGGILGGGLLSNVGNALTIGRIADFFGITNLSGSLSGVSGLLGNVTGGISNFLNLGLLGNGVSGATNAALAGLGPGVYGPATASAVQGATGLTIGGFLGGAGLGFGAGSLVNNLIGGNSTNGLLGAGGGAAIGATIGSIVPGIGTILGGLIGGLFGGVGGGIFGPQGRPTMLGRIADPISALMGRPGNPGLALLTGGLSGFFGPGRRNLFSATGLTLDDDGMLGVGRTFAQLADTSQEVAALQQEVATVNAILSSMGARVTNTTSLDEYGQRRINDANTNTWINVGQGDGRSQSLSFNALRFGSSDPMVNTALTSRSFENAEALAAELTAFSMFLQETAPALQQIASGDPSYGIGSLAESVNALRDQFNAAREVADRLGWAEYDLIDARERAIVAANDNVSQMVLEMDRSLLSRRVMAEGIAYGDIQRQLDATLWDFDAQTRAQRDAMRSSLLTTFGDAFEATSAFADQMQLLEETRGAERLATARSYLDAINAPQRQQAQQMELAAADAAGIVGGLTSYVRGISLGGESPLTQQQQYFSASTAFNQAISAARGGDGNALANITGVAETFRTQSRAMFGSGANFVTDFNNIVSSLQSIAEMPADTLTSAVFSVGIQTQTQTLVSALAELRSELVAIRSTLRQSANGPPALQTA